MRRGGGSPEPSREAVLCATGGSTVAQRRIAMDRTQSVVTPERFAQGMTFEQYVTYVGTPENLQREGCIAARYTARGLVRK